MTTSRPRFVLGVRLAAAVLAAGLASPLSTPAGVAQPMTPTPGERVTCEFTPTPDNPAARPVPLPAPRQRSTGTVDVLVVTNYGPMTFRLDRTTAPCAVGNLVHLARHHFYTWTQCFRLTYYDRMGIMQCGDLVKQEVGGPGYRFPDEVDGTETYPRGTIAMGNQGPGTNGSEWFVVYRDAKIKPNYTVMGHLIRGWRTLDRIQAIGTADGSLDGLPASPLRIIAVLPLRGR